MAKNKFEMISKDEAQEILNAVDSASDGYWFPLITVVACFGIVIALLLYIWNQTQRSNNKRHEDNEALIKELVESKHTNDLILQELKMITSMHGEKIKKFEK